jgi:hypothetical protein
MVINPISDAYQPLWEGVCFVPFVKPNIGPA